MLINRFIKSASLLITFVASVATTHAVWAQVEVSAAALSPSDQIATSVAQSSTSVMAERRQLLLERLQQLELDNERLRQQLTSVESSESVQSLQRVLDGHSEVIATLRAAQMPNQQPHNANTDVMFDAQAYQAPAAAGAAGAAVSSAVAQSNTVLGTDVISAISPVSAHRVSPASVWSLELAGASGVLALMGALVLLFVMTVLRKSYWLPRQSVVNRPPASVSERGLIADIATGYTSGEPIQAEPNTSHTAATVSVEAVTDQEQASRDQRVMALMLERGLNLSEDDLSLVPEKSSGQVRANSTESRAVIDAKCTETIKQAKNPLSDEYDLLGSSGFCSRSDDLFENAEFDELFHEAAQVVEPSTASSANRDPQAANPFAETSKTADCNQVRRSDEDVFRSIREKTCGYVAPTIDDGSYIVEESCDDLDKYMDIQFIEPPKIQLDEAKEKRDNRTFGL
jgi:hypothetical protein